MKCDVAQEHAIVFGRHENLVGIVRTADTDASSTLDTAFDTPLMVVMLNAGMLHSTGPFRLHVDLARSLAAVGLPSLRFDISGIGESLAIGASGSSLQRVANEVSTALDYAAIHFGIERFALFGLCAGADDALYAALQDTRIGGLFSVDGLGYRTRQYYRHRLGSYYWPKLTSPQKWQHWMLAALGRLPEVPASLQFGDDIREFPPREAAATQLRELVERRVQMHFHYTGGVGQYYNYAEQFQHMFPELFAADDLPSDGITTSFHPAADHVAYLCEHRADLVRLATSTLETFNAKVRPACRLGLQV